MATRVVGRSGAGRLVAPRPAPGANGRAPAAYARGPGQRAIGVFDSGVGGLTVLKALVEILPRENFVYLGDTARAPYGTKSSEVILRYSRENTEFLLAKGIKLLVIACNSSSAVALEAIAAETSVPVVGVIEPGARAAIKASRSGRIGVIGTEATIGSGAYTRLMRQLRPEVEIYTRACPMLVPLAEEGWTDNEVAALSVAHYLRSLKTSGIDTLLLGCTHYPLLKDAIGRELGAGVRLVDSALATAQAVAKLLGAARLAARTGTGGQSFFVTEAPDRFIKVGRRVFGPQVESAVQIER